MKAVVALTLLLSASIGADRSNNDDFVPLPKKQFRIHGGVVANVGTFPYMAALFIAKPDGDYFCGGSLISDKFVLTAAYCLSRATKVRVYLGVSLIYNNSVSNQLHFMVGQEGLIIHKYYAGLVHDIALIRLPQKVQFTSEMQPVRLVRRSQTNLDNFGTYIAGWGLTGNKGSRPAALRYAQSRILPNYICSKVYRRSYHPSHICIDGAGQSTCLGDSGGPAVIVDRKDGYHTEVGVAAYIHKGGCENGYPVAYTRVSSYLDWIQNHTGIPIRK